MKRKKRWIAISDNTYELIKKEGKFQETFDDVLLKIITKKDNSRQSIGFREP
jgi:predicted CopG family antitoxin